MLLLPGLPGHSEQAPRPSHRLWPPRRRAQDGTDAEELGHRAACPALPSVGLPEQPVSGACGSVVTRGFLETENPVPEPTDRAVSESPAPPQVRTRLPTSPRGPRAHLGRAVALPGASARPQPAAPQDCRRRGPDSGGSRRAAPSPYRGLPRRCLTPARAVASRPAPSPFPDRGHAQAAGPAWTGILAGAPPKTHPHPKDPPLSDPSPPSPGLVFDQRTRPRVRTRLHKDPPMSLDLPR